ncbi:MAG: hypothetical protein RLY93_14240 [Sumerlaeia bacterium]
MFGGAIAASWRDTPAPDFVFQEKVPSPILSPNHPFRLAGEWQTHPQGLSPAPGTTGHALEIEIPPGAWDSGELDLAAAPDSAWGLRLSGRGVTGDLRGARLLRPVHTDEPYALSPEDFPEGLDPASTVTLRLEPTDPGRAGEDFALLRGAQGYIARSAANKIAAFPDILALGLTPFLLAVFLRLYRGWGEKRSAALGLGGGFIGFFILSRAGVPTDVSFAPFATTLAGLTAMLCALSAQGIGSRAGRELGLSREQWLRCATLLALTAVGLLALTARWDFFEIHRRRPLGWDASGFVQIALSGGGLYDTAQTFAPWLREPLFPWLLRFGYALLPGPDSQTAARFVALLISTGVIVLIAATGWRVFGWFVGVTSGIFLALNPSWAEMGVRVLRLDMATAILAALILVRWEWAERAWTRALGWGLGGAAMILTRLSAISFVVPLLAWEAWRRRWHWAEIAAAAAMIVLLLAPHLAFNAEWSDGDPMASSTVHTRYYLNREMIGQPGFPATEAEWLADPYVGEPVSTGAYFLKYHSIPQLIAGHVKGYWHLFVWGPPRTLIFGGHEWLMLPCLLGGLALLLDPRRRWIALWFALAMFPFAYISTVKADWRLGGEATLFAIWMWAWGLQVGALLIWKKLGDSAALARAKGFWRRGSGGVIEKPGAAAPPRPSA